MPDNPYGVSKNFQVLNRDERTETYLLTNKGLEKLDVSKEFNQKEMKNLADGN